MPLMEKKNYKKMNSVFLHTHTKQNKKNVLESKANVVFKNWKNWKIKNSLKFAHFFKQKECKAKANQIGSYKTFKNLHICQFLKFNNWYY